VELYLSESRVVVDSQVSVSASLAGASSKPKQSARRTLFNTLRAA